LVFLIPINKIYYIKDRAGEIKLSRIDRECILFPYGTYFTKGVYESLFFLPDAHIRVKYISYAPFADGCFDLIAEFEGKKVTIYQGTPATGVNLNDDLQLIHLPNAFGEKNWMSIQQDKSGRYYRLDCHSGTE
jgi:hypothetical protein